MGQEQNTKEQRKWKQISERERYKIEDLRQARVSVSEIARQMKRDRRTIQREIARGSVVQRKVNPYVSKNPKVPEYLNEKQYCADVGQRVQREKGANKGRGLKIGQCHELAEYIEEKIIREKYSPEAVLGRVKQEGMKFSVTICTKTLYNYIDWEIFTGISNKDLPVKKNKQKRKYRQTRRIALNNTRGRSIEERPVEVGERVTSGHWEMDCVESGKGAKACLLVMTERQSRKEFIFKMKAQTQECVRQELDRLERRQGRKKFKATFKSMTMDNGSEFLDSEGLEASCFKSGEKRTTVYYAHPYSSWERGSNENANGLIRRFIPKGTNIGKYTHKEIKRIEHWLNNYPRRMFGFKSAAEVYAEAVG